MGEIAWNELLDALMVIEALPLDASGYYRIGGDSVRGGIFVERGRICWAAASHMQQRLGDLLRGSLRDESIDLEAIYQECRQQGTLLGETLLSRGLVDGEHLAAVLRQHSAESLLAMWSSPPQLTWTERRGASYAAQFTFRPIEILMEVAYLCFAAEQDEASAELAALAGEGRRGAAYFFDERSDLIVPLAVLGGAASVADVRTLGLWSLAVPRAARELGASPTFTVAATEEGVAVATWWRGPLLFALDCDDRRATAAVAARQLAQVHQ